MAPDPLATRLNEIRQRGALRRLASVARSAIDLDARTVELAFSSETDTVQRWFGIEILGHAAGEADLSRLANSAPLLWDHDKRDQRGVVVSARIDADGIGRAVVRFSRSPAGEQLFQDVLDGIVTKVSVGYSVEGLQLVEERGDVPVYRLTAWTPYEISLVSIPADDSVGVGRTAQPLENSTNLRFNNTRLSNNMTDLHLPNSNRAGSGDIQERSERRTMNAADALASQFKSTRQAPGDVIHYDHNDNVRGTTPRRAASVSHIDLRSEFPAVDPARFIGRLPTGTDAGKITTFDAALLASSAVLQAGALLILADDIAKPVPIPGGGLAFETAKTRFDLIAPATWHLTAGNDDEVPVGLPAINSIPIDMTEAHSLGVRVELSRAEQRQFASDGMMAAEVLTSFALGLGRALDQQFLAHFNVVQPTPFTLAKLASGGFQTQEARAIVGRDAAGAAIEPAGGRLHVNGIPSRFTDTTDETFIMVAHRHAIAVDSEIRVICQRTSVNGSLALTAWASVLPVYGDMAAVWKVAA